jgi:hypothetical protein
LQLLSAAAKTALKRLPVKLIHNRCHSLSGTPSSRERGEVSREPRESRRPSRASEHTCRGDTVIRLRHRAAGAEGLSPPGSSSSLVAGDSMTLGNPIASRNSARRV